MCLWIHHGVHKWAGQAQHLYKSPTLFSPAAAAADLWFRHPQMVWPLSLDPALTDHRYPTKIQVTALMGKKWEANQIMGDENGWEWVGISSLSSALLVSVSYSLAYLHTHIVFSVSNDANLHSYFTDSACNPRIACNLWGDFKHKLFFFSFYPCLILPKNHEKMWIWVRKKWGRKTWQQGQFQLMTVMLSLF